MDPALQNIDTDNAEFQNAQRLITHTKQSVFLTGKAGTGKSTFLKYICSTTKKHHVVLAPTGIAAINAGGMTIHSFFNMPFRPILPDDPELSLKNNRIFETLKLNKATKKTIESAKLIIIDEISMVRADMIDFIDKVLRVYSHNMREPFGGKQMLFVGDVYQLEPVVTSDQKPILSRAYPNQFFFSANVFKEMQLVTIELLKVYRQNDLIFIKILDNIRVNNVTNQDLAELNKRCFPNYKPGNDEFVMTVATKKNTVDFINENRLNELEGETFVFEGTVEGEFPENSMPSPKKLELKIGAQVIFTKNDKGQARRWSNGTIAKVAKIISVNGTDYIYVTLENGSEEIVENETWTNVRYKYDEKEKKVVEEELGRYNQFPLRLAWAITIHKSQGLTFDKVVVDLSGGAFAGGQTYVALSRCRSLKGLALKQKVSPSDVFVNKEIIKFAKQYNNQELFEQVMKQSRADHHYAAAVLHFDKRDFDSAIDNFFKAIHSRYDIEKPIAKRFIRKKLNCIKELEKENKMLKDRIHSQRSKFAEMADEFYLMGNECMVKLKDPANAIRNFDKALFLNPMHVDAWVRKGVTLYDTNDFYEAEKCFNKAVELSPTLFKALYNRGKNRIQTNNFDGALSDLLKANSLKPEHKMTHELLGNVYSQLGEIELAMKHWDIAKGNDESDF